MPKEKLNPEEKIMGLTVYPQQKHITLLGEKKCKEVAKKAIELEFKNVAKCR
jgi:hypothetical protein